MPIGGADIYELFFCADDDSADLLIGATQNRRVEGGGALWDAVAGQPPVGMDLGIPDKTGKKRVATRVEARFKDVGVLRPHQSGNQYESVPMNAIELKQVSEKQDWQEETLHWKLLTAITIENVGDALQCVKWYCHRWLTERFHHVLKSGTKIEELQLRPASSLQKAIHVYSMAAGDHAVGIPVKGNAQCKLRSCLDKGTMGGVAHAGTQNSNTAETATYIS